MSGDQHLVEVSRLHRSLFAARIAASLSDGSTPKVMVEDLVVVFLGIALSTPDMHYKYILIVIHLNRLYVITPTGNRDEIRRHFSGHLLA